MELPKQRIYTLRVNSTEDVLDVSSKAILDDSDNQTYYVLDGPAISNNFGHAYILGSQYIFFVGGYAGSLY